MPRRMWPQQPQLVRELGSILRNQVPAARRSVLEAYGETLCRAWREASGACALEVEALIQARMPHTPLCTHSKTGLDQCALLASCHAPITAVAAALRGHAGPRVRLGFCLACYQHEGVCACCCCHRAWQRRRCWRPHSPWRRRCGACWTACTGGARGMFLHGSTHPRHACRS